VSDHFIIIEVRMSIKRQSETTKVKKKNKKISIDNNIQIRCEGYELYTMIHASKKFVFFKQMTQIYLTKGIRYNCIFTTQHFIIKSACS
jgi:hypothetical protein